jgi:hypothetical protein
MIHQPKGVGFHGENARGKVEPSSTREVVTFFMNLETTKATVITNQGKKPWKWR